MHAPHLSTQLFVLGVGLLAANPGDCCQDAVGVVESLSGQATARAPGTRDKTTVSTLGWLPARVTLEVSAGSRITLILLSGRRYELAEGARATVTADALVKIAGPVRELKRLPPMPKLAPIVDNTAPRSGAVRLRGSLQVRNLYPSEGMAVLPDAARLSFSPLPQAANYRVEVEDEAGNTLLNLQTAAPLIPIPEGTLKAGRQYYWRVGALGVKGVIAEGMTDFITISAEDVLRRTDFARAVREIAEDASALALLATVDLRLGLLAEAREEFEAALLLEPGNLTIQRALEQVRSVITNGSSQ